MYSLFLLIPFDRKYYLTNRSEKINLLELCINILSESENAVLNFKNLNADSFDPQVGDTSCQARAFQIAWLRNDFNISPEKRSKIEKDFENIKLTTNIIKEKQELFRKLYITTSHYKKELDSREQFIIFLDCLNIEISEDTLLLITSHFLSIFARKDKFGYLAEVSYNDIASFLSVTKTLSKRLIKHYQKILASITCNLFYKISEKIWGGEVYNRITKGLTRHGDNMTECFPCFLGAKLLLLENFQHMIHINMKIVRYIGSIQKPCDTVELSWLPNPKTGTYHASGRKQDYQNDIFSITLVGYCIYNHEVDFENRDRYKERLIKEGLHNILLTNMAAHPQFSGNNLNAFKEDPYHDLPLKLTEEQSQILLQFQQELFAHKARASLIGCTKNNPKLFFLGHVNIRPTVLSEDKISI